MTFDNEIKAAIFAKLTSSSSWNTNIGGRVYDRAAPQNPTYPYCVYLPFFHTRTFDSGNQWEQRFYQFAIFDRDTSSGDIGTLESNLIDLLYGFELEPTNYTQIDFQREDNRYFPPTIDGVLQTIIEYRMEFQHD